ncbi:MAG: hypothetical protein JW748_02505 [Anaerolineales bacterium]|nr:hypothetical protein [Anaerolineales bacterium]
MKNLTPSGYQGFPALFRAMFDGTAMVFRRLAGRKAPAGPVGQSPKQESGELKPVKSSLDEPVSKKTGGDRSQ